MLIVSALLLELIYTSYDMPVAGSYICSIITHFSVFSDTIFINHFAVPDSRLLNFEHQGQRGVTVMDRLAPRNSLPNFIHNVWSQPNICVCWMED